MEMDKTFGTYSSFAPLCIRGPPNKSTRNSLLSALFDKFRIVGKPIKHTGYIMINISQAFLLDRGRGKTYVACTLCPRSSGPFDILSYYIKWVTTSQKRTFL